MTAPVWIRGILADDYGVPVDSVSYFTGGEEEPGRSEKQQLDLPPRIRIQPIGKTQTLAQMRADGEIDALHTARTPSVIRRDVYEQNRWVAQSLYKAFATAQRRTHEDLEVTAALKTMLPWLIAHVEGAPPCSHRSAVSALLPDPLGRSDGIRTRAPDTGIARPRRHSSRWRRSRAVIRPVAAGPRGQEGEPIEVPAHASILEALRAKGYHVPSSCESGTCGTCRTKVLASEPDHRDLVLTDDERRREMTVCVSRAKSPELVLEAPSAPAMTTN